MPAFRGHFARAGTEGRGGRTDRLEETLVEGITFKIAKGGFTSAVRRDREASADRQIRRRARSNAMAKRIRKAEPNLTEAQAIAKAIDTPEGRAAYAADKSARLTRSTALQGTLA
jgi:hypothetical protein